MTAPEQSTSDIDSSIGAIAALADPRRRAMYEFVIAHEGAASRDEAADAVGVSRSAAAFHLDRMVDEGLLDTEFRRLGSRQGPGGGRPSKLYRRAAGDISVSLPSRQYGLAADLLASAVTEATTGGEPIGDALRRLAHERGAGLAGTVAGAGDDHGAARVLAGHGYEPRVGDDAIVLANCPFHALAARHAELVCGMNLALLEGFAAALPGGGWVARLRPTTNGCCVRLERAP